MMHKEGRFKGLGDLQLYYQYWLPPGEIKSILMVAHGFAEYSGRYAHVAGYFVERGYAVYALDHRGHGRSEGERVYVEQFSDYVDDLKTFYDIIRKDNPGKKIFIVGHSMGSAIALLYTARYQDELGGMITSGGGIGRGDEPPQPSRAEGQPLPTDFLSRDPAVIEAYVNDPLVYRGPIPNRLGGMMGDVAGAVPLITIPALIMAGDAVADGARSQNLFEQLSSKDKTIKRYDGLRHEIFNEPERLQVFSDLEAWLEDHLGENDG
ncbi:MAG: lysophospholipase [Dehalococcoidales bacterium]|nr:MAG: lysophospholipase [Dehalococcoidales bacterium]